MLDSYPGTSYVCWWPKLAHDHAPRTPEVLLKPLEFLLLTAPSTSMDSVPRNTLKPGIVNLPGATPASTTLVSELLHKDFEAHHCFWNDHHFSNHLSHQ